MTLSTAYQEYALSTDDSYLNQAGEVHEAVSLRDHSVRRLMEGKDPEKVIQNGKTIRNFIQLEQKGTTHFFGPGGRETPSDPQVVSRHETPWAFIRDDMTWDDESLDTHEGDTAQTFFDLKRFLEQKCWLDKINFIETEGLWGQPNSATMETNNPKPKVRHMQSFPVLVNEENFGGVNATIPKGYVDNSVYTVQQLDARPTGDGTAWRCQQKQYSEGPFGDEEDTLLSSLSWMSRKVRFRGLPLGKGAYSTKSTMPAVIWCSIDGITMLEESMRQSQDSFVYMGKQDPAYPNPTIHGIPVEDLEIWETAEIFPTGTGNTYSTEGTQSAAANGGPRFGFYNLADMYMVVHSDKFFYKHPVRTPYDSPTRHTIYVDTYCNLTSQNRRTSGMVFPDENIVGFSG